jgi:predicted PurR-regulated permease PerM
MPDRSHSSPAVIRGIVLASSVIAVAALYLARPVLIPLTLAILFAFLLNPLVSRVKRIGVPHLLAVGIVSASAVLILTVLGVFLGYQIADVIQKFPEYQNNIQAKLSTVWSPVSRFMQRGAAAVSELQAIEATDAPAPVPVTIVDASAGTHLLTSLLALAIEPIAAIAIVSVLAVAMLIQGADLRDRVVRLIGARQVSMTTQALDDVASRVSRYLLVQTLLNGSLGLVLAGGLWLIGLPNALLWGMIWSILRFIPYIGPWVGGSLPVFTALGQFDGWTGPLMVIGIVILVEVVCNTILEPWLYGSGTGLSPVAVLVSAVFWAWLWGWVGLLLATPMTVCLAVLGTYVPQLGWLQILLGDRPVLRPSVRLYQRLLGKQDQEARSLLVEEFKRSAPAVVYERVVIPALAYVDADERRGALDDKRVDQIRETLAEVLADVSPQIENRESSVPAGCLCIPARDGADQLCGQLLRMYLASRGVELDVAGEGMLSNEVAELVQSRRPAAVLISGLDPSRLPYARHLMRRIAGRSEDVTLIVGIWTSLEAGDVSASDAPLELPGAELVTNFVDAMDALRFALHTHKLKTVEAAAA